MDIAVWKAFQLDDFDDLLDMLTLESMNFSRQVDGTTPLMAACRRGHTSIVQLFLDLNCDPFLKDLAGQSAREHALQAQHFEIERLLKNHTEPQRDSCGRPIFTWDRCSHPRENLFLDCESGSLVCTACALILKENALQMDSDGNGKPRQIASIRGADAEYNEWRSGELDIIDVMSKLGIVDNDAAYAKGRAASIWAKRERALQWLDMRRRIRNSTNHRRHLQALNGIEISQDAMPSIPSYSREGPMLLLGPQRSEPSPSAGVMLRFHGGVSEAVRALEAEEEDVDLIIRRAQLQRQPPAKVVRRRRCVAAWQRVWASLRQDVARQNRWAACQLLDCEASADEAAPAAKRGVAEWGPGPLSEHTGSEEQESESEAEVEIEWEAA